MASQQRAGTAGQAALPTLAPLGALSIFTIVLTALGLAGALYEALTSPATLLDPVAATWMVAWLVLSLIFSVLARRHVVLGFSGGLLFLLAAWRLAGPLNLLPVVVPVALAALVHVLQFLLIAVNDRKKGAGAYLTLAQWQLTFIRLYIAFDMIPHFTEKLFAGPIPFHEDAAILARYGMSPPELFVIAGGLCELAVAIGLGLGILTRVAAVGAALYFLVTSMIGHHFGRGFIWNLNGGGWEYPLLMLCLFLSFAFTGGGRFSFDYLLAGCRWWPRFLSSRLLTSGVISSSDRFSD